MKENEEEIKSKFNKVSDLLTPLINENDPKARRRFSNMDASISPRKLRPPNQSSQLLFKNIDINHNHNDYFNNDQIKKTRTEINPIKKESDSEISNYSNMPKKDYSKCLNWTYIFFITIFSSLQFGIYLYVFNLYMNGMNGNSFFGQQANRSTNIPNISNQGLFYSFFLVLSWKYQVYLIFYVAYAFYIYYKFTNKRDDIQNTYDNFHEDTTPLITKHNSMISHNSLNSFITSFGNPTFRFREFKYKYLKRYGSGFDSYYKIFIYTSNIFNTEGRDINLFQYLFNLDEVMKDFSGLLFAYLILVGSYFYYFGIIYLIQEITSLLPYYIQYNKTTNSNQKNNISRGQAKNWIKKNHEVNYSRYIFPLTIALGLFFLQKTITNNIWYLIALLFGCICLQLFNQKQFILHSHEESPFQLLFRTYFSYTIISLITILTIEVSYNGFHILNIFYWLIDIKIFLACIIGFGICGAIFYNIMIVFMRISLSNNNIIKFIKYFNLLICDVVGVFLFRQYIIVSYLDYMAGLALCCISMFILEFHKIL